MLRIAGWHLMKNLQFKSLKKKKNLKKFLENFENSKFQFFGFFYFLYTLKAPLSQKTQNGHFDDRPPLREHRWAESFDLNMVLCVWSSCFTSALSDPLSAHKK